MADAYLKRRVWHKIQCVHDRKNSRRAWFTHWEAAPCPMMGEVKDMPEWESMCS